MTIGPAATAAPLIGSMRNDRRNMSTTNTSTDATAKPNKKPKPKARKLQPVPPHEALEMLRSAIVYCQISGVPIKYAANATGLRLQLDDIFLDGVRLVLRRPDAPNHQLTPIAKPD